MKHELVGDTLSGNRGGITATCTCGWTSSHITNLGASSAFRDHQRSFEKPSSLANPKGLLTEIADDEPGSWGQASDGWPGVRGDQAYDLYVFAARTDAIPYGSYVLMSQRGKYNATESYLRVRKDYLDKLQTAYSEAGQPTADLSTESQA